MTDEQVQNQLRVEVYLENTNEIYKLYSIEKALGTIHLNFFSENEVRICINNYLDLNIFEMQLSFDNDFNSDNSETEQIEKNDLIKIRNRLVKGLSVSNEILSSQNYKKNSQVLAFNKQKQCSQFFIFLTALQIFVILSLAFYQLASLKKFLTYKHVI